MTTNVPGPRETLYGFGCELLQILPYVPIADRVRIGVAMFSVADQDEALAFYTEKLGFEVRSDSRFGENGE